MKGVKPPVRRAIRLLAPFYAPESRYGAPNASLGATAQTPFSSDFLPVQEGIALTVQEGVAPRNVRCERADRAGEAQAALRAARRSSPRPRVPDAGLISYDVPAKSSVTDRCGPEVGTDSAEEPIEEM